VSDRLELVGLRVLGHHGALPGEQDRAQPFELDLFIDADFSAAVRSDELADAVDYGGLIAAARAIVENERFALLEALASAVAEALLAADGVLGVTVVLRKLRPPVPAQLESAGVRVSRTRPGTAPTGTPPTTSS
jgi:dihydroneopterin aldolase